MSHVDEGALHAYLDGALDEYPAAEAERIRAHLDKCAECAGRLEEERRVHGDAHAILALASPEVELPGLEELKAYVQRTRPVRSGTSTRLWRLGWAASVMLALGTGWLVRGQAGQTSRMTAPFPAAEGIAESNVGAVVAAGSRADFADGQVAKANSEMTENEQLAGAGAAAPTVPGAALSDLMADASSEPAAAEAVTPTVGAAGSGAGTTAGAAAPPAEPVHRPTDRVLDVDAPSSEVVALSVAPVAQAAAAPAETVTTSAGEPARARAESPVAITSAMERSVAPGRRSAADDEAIDPSVPSLVVPGLEVVSVTNLGPGTTANGVHVVQRLDSGVLVDIWHLEPDVDRGVLPARPDRIEEVAELTENGWIVIRGAAARDELVGLLDSLRPGGG